MPEFEYKAYDSSGASTKGIIDAIDIDEVKQKLKQQGLIPSAINAYRETPDFLKFFDKVNLSDLEFLTAELSLLLKSGVRIDRGIDIIQRLKSKPVMAKLLTKVSQSLKKGNSLSDSMAEYPEVFDPLYLNLVSLGEASGNLKEIFAGLAADLKFRQDLRNKVISALTYPAVILFVCILSIFFIFNFIVPQLSSLFSDVENLPYYTRALLGISDWMVNYQWFLVIGSILLIPLGIYIFRQKQMVQWWQKTVLKIPGIKGSIHTVERIRFTSGLTLMLKAGLAIDKAMTLACGNIKNESLRREIEIANKKIKSGGKLTTALEQSILFPPFFASLLEVGEESGNLAAIFDEITQRSRQDFDQWTQKMTTLIEPLLILVMGTIVGGVVIVMLMSMVSINDIGF